MGSKFQYLSYQFNFYFVRLFQGLVMADLKKLVRSRAGIKGKISIALKQLETCDIGGREAIIELIKTKLEVINNINLKIEDVYEADGTSVDDDGQFSSDYESEIANAISYKGLIESKLSAFKGFSNPSSNIKPMSFDLKLPNLELEYFSGEEKDALKYSEFIGKFKNLIGNRDSLSKSVKLTYLKNYIRGYAAKVISHLIIEDQNYDVALAILDAEFLSVKEIVHFLYKKTY